MRRLLPGIAGGIAGVLVVLVAALLVLGAVAHGGMRWVAGALVVCALFWLGDRLLELGDKPRYRPRRP